MNGEGTDGRLDDATIEVLLDSGPNVRFYLAKVVSLEPFDRVEEAWTDERPDDLKEVYGGDLRPAVNLSAPGEVVRYFADGSLAPVERDYVEALRESVYEGVREAQRRLALTPTEFSVYLLSQAAGLSAEAVADELDLAVAEVETSLERAREKFRRSMRMIDLCERLDDPELADDLAAWRIHRDPVFTE